MVGGLGFTQAAKQLQESWWHVGPMVEIAVEELLRIRWEGSVGQGTRGNAERIGKLLQCGWCCALAFVRDAKHGLLVNASFESEFLNRHALVEPEPIHLLPERFARAICWTQV